MRTTAFRTLDQLREGGVPAQLSETERQALCAGADELASVLCNDLTAPALHLYPELATTIHDATDAGACAAILSGSGPTIAVLARNREQADELAEALRTSNEVSAVLPTSGPAVGAIVEEEGS